MSYTKSPFYKSRAFWTHFAVSSAAVSSAVTSVVDKGFSDTHPVIATAIVVISGLALAVSQAAYVISDAMKSQAQAASVDATVPVFAVPQA